MDNTKSKVTGGLNDGLEKEQLATQSSSAASTKKQEPQIILATSESSQTPKSQIGFQPTQALGAVDEETANAQIIAAFASKLGVMVSWEKIELEAGLTGFALFFPDDRWSVSNSGSLVARR